MARLLIIEDEAGRARVVLGAPIPENRSTMRSGLKILDVPEPRGANALRIGERVLMPLAYPRTCDLLDRSGFRVRTIDNSELLKAEAGVTCTSLIFEMASDPFLEPDQRPLELRERFR